VCLESRSCVADAMTTISIYILMCKIYIECGNFLEMKPILFSKLGWILFRNLIPPFQGCQMVCFQTKNPNLGKFWRVLQWKMMVYFIDTWSILRSFIIFYGHLVQFVAIWYIFSGFGIFYKEKSGNPAPFF
jgi:hypothetical protein